VSDGDISYEQFGVNFIANAITPERVGSTLKAVSGDVIEVGPMPVGPANAATVVAIGRIGEPEVVRGGFEPLEFTVTLPADVALDVKVAGANHHFDARLRIPLHLTIRTAEPLDVVIDVARVSAQHVDVDMRATGVRAKVIQRLGNAEVELRRHVARFVRDRVDDPAGQKARRIALLPLIDEAWNPDPRQRPRAVTPARPRASRTDPE
jgi:hypothetical protein